MQTVTITVFTPNGEILRQFINPTTWSFNPTGALHIVDGHNTFQTTLPYTIEKSPR